MSGGAPPRAVPAGAAEENGAAPQPRVEEPFDPSRSQEITRRAIAIGVLVTTGLMIVGFAALLLADATAASRVEKAVALLLAPLLGFSGTVVGFYFGEKAGRASKG